MESHNLILFGSQHWVGPQRCLNSVIYLLTPERRSNHEKNVFSFQISCSRFCDSSISFSDIFADRSRCWIDYKSSKQSKKCIILVLIQVCARRTDCECV